MEYTVTIKGDKCQFKRDSDSFRLDKPRKGMEVRVMKASLDSFFGWVSGTIFVHDGKSSYVTNFRVAGDMDSAAALKILQASVATAPGPAELQHAADKFGEGKPCNGTGMPEPKLMPHMEFGQVERGRYRNVIRPAQAVWYVIMWKRARRLDVSPNPPKVPQPGREGGIVIGEYINVLEAKRHTAELAVEMGYEFRLGAKTRLNHSVYNKRHERWRELRAAALGIGVSNPDIQWDPDPNYSKHESIVASLYDGGGRSFED